MRKVPFSLADPSIHGLKFHAQQTHSIHVPKFSAQHSSSYQFSFNLIVKPIHVPKTHPQNYSTPIQVQNFTDFGRMTQLRPGDGKPNILRIKHFA